MIKEFVEAWDAKKDDLRQYFRNHRQIEYDSYEKLLSKILEIVINPFLLEKGDKYSTFVSDKTLKIDDGDYQGTLIFVFHRYSYQPDGSDYVCTCVGYGSCSGCDTLLAINDYTTKKLPTEQQLEDYMTLCLHMLQRCNYMFSDSE